MYVYVDPVAKLSLIWQWDRHFQFRSRSKKSYQLFQ